MASGGLSAVCTASSLAWTRAFAAAQSAFASHVSTGRSRDRPLCVSPSACGSGGAGDEHDPEPGSGPTGLNAARVPLSILRLPRPEAGALPHVPTRAGAQPRLHPAAQAPLDVSLPVCPRTSEGARRAPLPAVQQQTPARGAPHHRARARRRRVRPQQPRHALPPLPHQTTTPGFLGARAPHPRSRRILA